MAGSARLTRTRLWTGDARAGIGLTAEQINGSSGGLLR
jgi:hypothetical protein